MRESQGFTALASPCALRLLVNQAGGTHIRGGMPLTPCRHLGPPYAQQREAAVAWQRADRELKALEPQLPAMERAAGLKPMHELEQEQHELKTQTRKLLREASKDLRTANGRIENELTRCGHDERPLLFAMRREIDLEMRQLQELHQGIPDPAEALQLRESAAQRLVQVEGWRESQDAAKAATEDQRLRERQRHSDEDLTPRPRGPSGQRMG